MNIFNQDVAVLGDLTLALDNASGNLVTIDGTGIVKFRLPSEILSDINGMSKAVYDPAAIEEQLIGIEAVQTVSNKILDNTDSVTFDLTKIANPAEGELAWNLEDGTLDLGMGGGNVVLQVGQEQLLKVKADVDISDGDVVYVTGAVGASGRVTINKFIADNSIEEKTVIGIATESILTGEFGFVTIIGNVRGIPTDGTAEGETWIDGDLLYASPTVAGDLTKIQPVAPNQDIPIAIVVRAHATVGTLLIRATSLGYHIGELHDVEISAEADKDAIMWSTTNSRWENRQLDVSDISGLTGPTTFIFDQGLPITVWNINHNLNKYPSVTVVDSGNTVVVGQINYTDLNNLILTFNSAFSGKAYLN